MYNNSVIDVAKQVKPSPRGELEITDLNNSYIGDGKLNVKLLKDNAAWFDTGNADAMFEAAMFIKSIQSRTGQIIGCIEEVAYKMRLIDEHAFYTLIREMPSCQYKRYLRNKYQVLNQVA